MDYGSGQLWQMQPERGGISNLAQCPERSDKWVFVTAKHDGGARLTSIDAGRFTLHKE